VIQVTFVTAAFGLMDALPPARGMAPTLQGGQNGTPALDTPCLWDGHVAVLVQALKFTAPDLQSGLVQLSGPRRLI